MSPRTLADEPAPPAPDETAPLPAPTVKAAVPWQASLKFRAYVGSWLTLVFGWAVENLTTHQFQFRSWTFIAVTVSTLVLAKSVVTDWMNPAVVAPFAIMNRKNTEPLP